MKVATINKTAISLMLSILMLTATILPFMNMPKAEAQSESPIFRFAAFGDSECGESNSETLMDEIDSRTSSNKDIVIGAGDYCYDSGSDANFWNNLADEINNIFRPSVGNHDESDWPSYVSRYNDYYSQINENGGAGYYDYTKNNTRFIVLNTDLTLTEGSTQHNWLESALADAQADEANGQIDWIVSYFHKVMYEQPGSSHQAESYLYNDVAEDFDNAGVDLVLWGHQHYYASTCQVSPDGTDSPTVLDCDSVYTENANGFVGATVGIGGRDPHIMDSTKPAWIDSRRAGDTGAMYCDVYESKIDCDTILINDSVIDSFEINKVAQSQGGHTAGQNPYGVYDGVNDQIIVPENSTQDLSTFTTQVYFRTTEDFTTDAMLVNKGGKGTDTAGSNMNYGIWMTSAEKIACGFEEGSGTDHIVTTTNSYNDGEWHLATCTYGGSTVRLYIDAVQSVTHSTATVPETNNQPIKIGANSRTNDSFFKGDIDSVKVYNRAWSATEIDTYWDATTITNNNGLVYTNSYPDPDQFNEAAALDFIESMYETSDNMVKECPTCTKKWLWSDQLLAQIVLKNSDPTKAAAIEAAMDAYLVSPHNLDIDNPWATFDPEYRAEFARGGTSEIQVGSTNKWYSHYGGSGTLSCSDYADIAFLTAIHEFYNNNLAAAETCYNAGKAMWDGVGMDDAGQITGDYAIYKTALGMAAEKITGFDPIGIPANYFDDVQASNGGVYTDIIDGNLAGSQNVETTFAVLIANNPDLL